jgi:hypothetical protein
LSVRATVFLALREISPADFDPVGVLAWVRSPLPGWCVDACFLLALATGFCFVIGAAFRITGPLFAVAVLVLTTYRSSFGQILWLENLMVLHLLIVGFSRSADALAWRPPRRQVMPSEVSPSCASAVSTGRRPTRCVITSPARLCEPICSARLPRRSAAGWCASAGRFRPLQWWPSCSRSARHWY